MSAIGSSATLQRRDSCPVPNSFEHQRIDQLRRLMTQSGHSRLGTARVGKSHPLKNHRTRRRFWILSVYRRIGWWPGSEPRGYTTLFGIVRVNADVLAMDLDADKTLPKLDTKALSGFDDCFLSVLIRIMRIDSLSRA
jgi:hypothetical protein